MKILSQRQLENQVHQFNQTYKVGDEVEVLKRSTSDETFIDKIKHPASIMGGHTAMAWLQENGSYDLTFVKGFAKKYKYCTIEFANGETAPAKVVKDQYGWKPSEIFFNGE